MSQSNNLKGEMTSEKKHGSMFQHAREVIQKDTSIPPEEKESVLRLIQVLVDVADASTHPKEANHHIESFAQELVSKHSLMMTARQLEDELNALKSISRNITSSLNLQTVLDAVVSEAMKLLKNARSAHIFLYLRGTLEFGASLTQDGVKNKAFSNPRPGGLTYSVAKSGKQITVEDMKTHPLFINAPSEWYGSIIGVPLKFSGSIVGVMNISRDIIGAFTDSEMRLIELLADHAAVAISHASLHQSVAEMANTDGLTGLPNRRALDERLQEEMNYARRTKTSFAVVMMDLDGFKHVNDTMGHVFGDELLRATFNYLAERMRATDFLARYGGDELTLIMRESGLEEAELVTKKIIDVMKKFAYPLPGKRPIVLGITAGIAVYPLHSGSAPDLLRAADSALYQAKRHSRGSYGIARGVTGPLKQIQINASDE